MRKNKLNFRITYEWLYTQYVELKKSFPTIGKEIGVNSEILRLTAKKLNIKIRLRSEYSTRKGMKCSEEHKRKLSEAQKRIWEDEEYRKFQSEIQKGKHYQNIGRIVTEKTKRLLSEARKGKCYSTPEQKLEHSKRMSGSGNPRWKGGISHLPYCELFNDEFKEKIRIKFDRKCFLCNKTENETGRKHDVHHIDFNKLDICNGKEWPFVPLCRSCHTKTSNNRFFYFNLFINYWIMNNNICLDTSYIKFGDLKCLYQKLTI
jgi:hypothetical protein